MQRFSMPRNASRAQAWRFSSFVRNDWQSIGTRSCCVQAPSAAAVRGAENEARFNSSTVNRSTLSAYAWRHSAAPRGVSHRSFGSKGFNGNNPTDITSTEPTSTSTSSSSSSSTPTSQTTASKSKTSFAQMASSEDTPANGGSDLNLNSDGAAVNSISADSSRDGLPRAPKKVSLEDLTNPAHGGAGNINGGVATTTPYPPQLLLSPSSSSPSPQLTYSAEWVRFVHVHPLSQIILQYLQNKHHEFLQNQGLTLLRLHRDGSFELLQEPEPQESPTSAKGMGNGGTNDSDADLAQKSGIPVIDKRKVAAGHGNASKTTGQLGAEEHAPTRYGTLRIWTSYDEMEKKHWLTVRNVESEEDDHAAAGPHSKPPNGEGEQSKPSLYRRFLLQDNLLPAWHGSTRRISLPSRIHESVEQMVETILRAK